MLYNGKCTPIFFCNPCRPSVNWSHIAAENVRSQDLEIRQQSITEENIRSRWYRTAAQPSPAQARRRFLLFLLAASALSYAASWFIRICSWYRSWCSFILSRNRVEAFDSGAMDCCWLADRCSGDNWWQALTRNVQWVENTYYKIAFYNIIATSIFLNINIGLYKSHSINRILQIAFLSINIELNIKHINMFRCLIFKYSRASRKVQKMWQRLLAPPDVPQIEFWRVGNSTTPIQNICCPMSTIVGPHKTIW